MSQNECMNSKYKLYFRLKQHTPIIHFQADQRGATLRASELKPKLDKFLIENLELAEIKKIKGKNKEVPKEDYKSWFIGGGKEHLALDYKVRIEPNSDSKMPISNSYVNLYFAGRKPRGKDSAEWNKIKSYFKYNEQKFDIAITVLNQNLGKAIKAYFSSFIFQTNFGSRQSKGFGSFVVLNDDIRVLPQHLYRFKADSQKDVFDKIYYFYAMLRAGINLKKLAKDAKKGDEPITIFYGKSLLWLYAKNKQWTWDKKLIKKTFLKNTDSYKEQEKKYTDNEDIFLFEGEKEFLIKDLLGLSTEEKWGSYYKTIKKVDTKEVIKRFKSPITFKPIKGTNGWNVYFWANDIPDTFLQSTFDIIVNGDSEKLPLSPPSTFDIYKYLQFVYIFAKKGCLREHIDIKFHVDPPCGFDKPDNYKPVNIYSQLDEIFTSIERVTL